MQTDEELLHETDHQAADPSLDGVNRLLAVCLQGDKLGVCVFLEDENIMQISQDLPASHADMGYTLECFKAGVQPNLILTTQHIANNADLLGLLTAPLIEGDEPFQHKVLKNACWDYGSAVRAACAHLKVKDLMQSVAEDGSVVFSGEESEAAAYNLLSGAIDFSAQQSVRALGALIGHMQVSLACQ